MAVQSFRESIAWQKAMDLSVAVYDVTRVFPKEEMFGLTNQLRRASVSVASLTTGEFIQFLGIARGSALEVETQLDLAMRLGLGVPPDISDIQRRATEVVRTINASISGLRRKQQQRGKD